MTSCPIIALLDFSRPFDLDCSASREDIGAILSQDCHPIAFENKKLEGPKRSCRVCDKEILAIMHPLSKFMR